MSINDLEVCLKIDNHSLSLSREIISFHVVSKRSLCSKLLKNAAIVIAPLVTIMIIDNSGGSHFYDWDVTPPD